MAHRVTAPGGKETGGELDTRAPGGIHRWWLIGEATNGWLYVVSNSNDSSGSNGFTLEKVK
jgi:hypothetical protein